MLCDALHDEMHDLLVLIAHWYRTTPMRSGILSHWQYDHNQVLLTSQQYPYSYSYYSPISILKTAGLNT